MTEALDLDDAILALLRRRRGRAGAITADEIGLAIAGRRGLDREVRKTIKRLIELGGHGEIIASTGGDAFGAGAPGYFWAGDAQEIRAYYAVLVSRKEEVDHRMRAAWAAMRRLERRHARQLSLADLAEPTELR